MKKLTSILVAMLLVFSACTVLAARPENLAVYSDDAVVENKVNLANEILQVESVSVSGAEKNSDAFGGPESLIDGVGMVDGVNLKHGDDVGVVPTANRWVTKGTNLPTFTFEFENDVTINYVAFTEGRKLIQKYELRFYKDNVLVHTAAETITGSAITYTNAYLREKSLGNNVVADKVEFVVTERFSGTTNPISVTEMQFVCKKNNTVTASSSHSTSGSANTIIDGIGMETANGSTPQANGERWLSNNKTGSETITLSLEEAAYVSAIKFTEVRREMKDYTIVCYKGDTKVYEKTASFNNASYNSNPVTIFRTIDLGTTVNTDKIVMTFTHGNNQLISIQELELYEKKTAPTIVDADGTAIALFNDRPITKAFDGVYDTTPADGGTTNRYQFVAYDSANNNTIKVKTPITIQFDLGEEKTFNYAELSELRCIFGEIDVYYFGESGWTLAGTMPKMAYDGNLETEYVHSIGFEPVTARLVKYVIKEIAAYSEFEQPERTANINEISLCNYTEDEEVTIYPIQAFGNEINEFTYDYVKSGISGTVAYNNVNTNVFVKNTSNSEKDYTIIAVFYNYNDEMVGTVTKNIALNPGESITQNIALPLTGSLISQGKVSFMVWDMETLTPYCSAETLDK